MKDATLAQGNQVLSLILQKKGNSVQVQQLLESGFLSDLLETDFDDLAERGIERDHFQNFVFGFRPASFSQKKDPERTPTERFQHDLEKKVNVFEQADCKREAAGILAEELQRLLACDNLSRQIPHSNALELILRAVLAAIRNRRHDGRYLACNLNNGLCNLKEGLGRDMPEFVEHFDYAYPGGE